MRCEYCDVVVADGSRFCDRCGAPIASESILNDTPEPPAFLAPAGWVHHRDAWTGFRVYHPTGWRVETNAGAVTIAEHPASPLRAFLQILRSPNASAQALATKWAHARGQADPSLRITPLGPMDDRRAHLKASAVLHGVPVEGEVTVEARGATAVLKGYCGPPQHMQAAQPLLQTVLASFAPVPSIRKAPWVDSSEGAFRVIVPSSWSANGGIRRDSGAPRGFFEAWGDPNGLMRVRLFADLQQFFEGMGGGGGGMLGALLGALDGSAMMAAAYGGQTAPYLPAPRYIAESLVPRWQSEHRDMQLLGIRERPDLVPELLVKFQRECAARMMTGLSADITVAEALVAYTVNGVPVIERLAVEVTRMGGGMSGVPASWIAEATSRVRAPQISFDRVEPILMGIVLSHEINQGWEQGNRDRDNARAMAAQQDIWARQRQISQTLSETSDIVAGAYWSSQQIHQEHAQARNAAGNYQSDWSQEWSNAMLGWEDRVDDTGQVYSIPAGAERAWRDNQGNLITGGWLANPDPTWHELKPTR